MENKKNRKKVRVSDIVWPTEQTSKRKINKEEEKPVILESKEEKKSDSFFDLEGAGIKRKEKNDFPDIGLKKEKSGKSRNRKGLLLIASAIVAVIVIVCVLWFVLPEAQVKISTKKVNWSFNEEVLVSKSSDKIDLTSKQIPGELLIQKKNGTFSFSPTGKKYVEQKAEGEILVFNAYSSSPQVLVATTRFQTPDGKILRLKEKITVPGAKISGGNIEPSSIKALVVADKAGPDYNIGPVEKLSIPGFSGSDKYDKFYGKLEGKTSGGFIGESPYPTKEDIAKAEEQAESLIKEAALSSIYLQIPQEAKFISGTEKISLVKEEVNTRIGDDGKFSVTIEAEISLMLFSEDQLVNLMKQLVTKENNLDADYKEKEKILNYGSPKTDWKSGIMTLPVNYDGIFWKEIKEDEIKGKILGKKESELKNFILSLPGVEKLTVSFWPFWTQKIPNNPSKVEITIE